MSIMSPRMDMTDNHKMLLRLRNVNDMVNNYINHNVMDLKPENIADWNWIVKGKMRGKIDFSNLYALLTKKMTTHDLFEIIIHAD